MNDAERYRRRLAEGDRLREAFYVVLETRLLELTGRVVHARGLGASVTEVPGNWANRRVDWDWNQLRWDFSGYPARFELALSVGDELCGLAVGRPSKGRTYMKMYFMEGNPDPAHPLKGSILTSMLYGVELYAIMFECAAVRLVTPLPAVIPHYEAAGYQIVKGQDGRVYCQKPMMRI